jgi:hypothetical protein
LGHLGRGLLRHGLLLRKCHRILQRTKGRGSRPTLSPFLDLGKRSVDSRTKAPRFYARGPCGLMPLGRGLQTRQRGGDASCLSIVPQKS